MDSTLLNSIAASPWLLPLVLALVIGDAFLVVLPSETAVVAVAAVSASTGTPPLAALIAVATAGALIGDTLCFGIGHRVGLDRWSWQRRGVLGRAIERAQRTVLSRPAVLIFTARYVPFARIAVNLTAGASGLPARRFVPLAAAAGLGWALYNCAIGAVLGTALSDMPLLAIAVSMVVAIVLGLTVDAAVGRLSRQKP